MLELKYFNGKKLIFFQIFGHVKMTLELLAIW